MQITVPINCHGTKHFYSMVRVLNQQVGRNRWTTHGRVVRKLRRLDRSNYYPMRGESSFPVRSMNIQLKVPQGYEDIVTTLNLWSEHGQR